MLKEENVVELKIIQESIFYSVQLGFAYEFTFHIYSRQLKMPALVFDHLKLPFFFLVFSFLQLSFWRQNLSYVFPTLLAFSMTLSHCLETNTLYAS